MRSLLESAVNMGSNNLTKWRNQKYFSTWQSRAWETGKPGMSYINENSFSRLLRNQMASLHSVYKSYPNQLEIIHI